MRTRKSSFGCFAGAIGMLIVLGFVAFIAANSLMARAEAAFGPPAAELSPFHRIRLGAKLGWRADALLRPVDASAAGRPFNIGLDEPTGEIVQRMQTDGLIRDAELFTTYLIYTGLDTKILSGYYLLSAAMNAPQLAESLIDPTPGTVTLVILPGWRLEEIAASLPSAGILVTPEEFLLATWSPHDLNITISPPGTSLEGYILPASYEIIRQYDDAQRLLIALLADFEATISQDWRVRFDAQGLSLHEAIILASIVERESVLHEEMGMIASVFLNRLDTGMQLEADPTVQYALGYDEGRSSWWKTPLSSADLQINSPYNTYRNTGLPPGPIAAPSIEALNAIAFPEESPFYFFQAACDGSGRHVFAVTYEEHLANNCR